MKYFFDTEFIEGFHKPLFGKKRHFIDLISIGIVAEDGRTYYAISNEFNPQDADEWVNKNVIDKLEQKATSIYDSPRLRQNCLLYKSNKQIADDIVKFCFEGKITFKDDSPIFNNPEFYAYYADYDWVVFCSLFGRMLDLPHGFPMYCKDLKQMLDEREQSGMIDGKFILTGGFYLHGEMTGIAASFDSIKDVGTYPKQKNEHNALDDAKWNKELYGFITGI